MSNKVFESGWQFADIALPISIVFGALLLGVIIELVARRILNWRADKRGWTFGRALIQSFKWMPTLWLGLIALQTELDSFPLLPKVSHLIENAITILSVLTVTILFTRVGTAVVRNYSSRSEGVGSRITILENLVKILIYIFGILMIFHNLGVSITPILTALGVGGLAVALALQDTLSNLFAGLYIIMSKQIDPGDYIKLESGQEGTIIDIAWRVTTIRTIANTMVIIPNAKFASSSLTNYDRPEKLSTIVITFELKSSAEVDQISTMLLDISKQVIDEYPEADKTFVPVIHYAAITESTLTINLVLRVAEYRQRGILRDAVYKKFFERLKAMHPESLPLAPPPATVAVPTKPV